VTLPASALNLNLVDLVVCAKGTSQSDMQDYIKISSNFVFWRNILIFVLNSLMQHLAHELEQEESSNASSPVITSKSSSGLNVKISLWQCH
jgi:hypothetical protein